MKRWILIIILLCLGLFLLQAGEYHFNGTLTEQYELAYDLGFGQGYLEGYREEARAGR